MSRAAVEVRVQKEITTLINETAETMVEIVFRNYPHVSANDSKLVAECARQLLRDEQFIQRLRIRIRKIWGS